MKFASVSDPSVLTPPRGSYASAAQKNVPTVDSGDALLIDPENELPGRPLTFGEARWPRG